MCIKASSLGQMFAMMPIVRSMFPSRILELVRATASRNICIAPNSAKCSLATQSLHTTRHCAERGPPGAPARVPKSFPFLQGCFLSH